MQPLKQFFVWMQGMDSQISTLSQFFSQFGCLAPTKNFIFPTYVFDVDYFGLLKKKKKKIENKNKKSTIYKSNFEKLNYLTISYLLKSTSPVTTFEYS